MDYFEGLSVVWAASRGGLTVVQLLPEKERRAAEHAEAATAEPTALQVRPRR